MFGLSQGLHGDVTTTGVICLTSLPNCQQQGRGVLRLGDKTTQCPNCGVEGTIVEGSNAFEWHGRPTAVHNAEVSCGCPSGTNRLIAEDPPERTTPPTSQTVQAPPSQSSSTAARSLGFTGPNPSFSTETAGLPAEPGFYIVPQSIKRHLLVSELLGEAPTPDVLRKFNSLNHSLGDLVKAGQLVVLSDPRSYMCTRQEAHLVQAAEETADALKDLSPSDADFMIKHRGEIAAALGSTSTWAGVTATVLEKHVKAITDILLDLQKLHQDTYRRHGHLKVPGFFEKRKQLLAQLDARFFNSTRLRSFTSLGDHPSLRKSLNISTKSLVHHWSKAGGPGDIPGYSNYVKPMAQAVKYMTTGGLIAIGIGGVSSALLIWETCTTGTEEECSRVTLKEGSKFIGATSAGLAVGAVVAKPSLHICLGRSNTYVGGVICSIVVVGAASWLGGTLGGVGGEFVGESIHDHFLRD